MAWWDDLKTMFGGVLGNQTPQPQVQAINPDTSQGQPAALPPGGGAPAGGAGGPLTGVPIPAAGAAPATGGAAAALPASVNIEGIGNIPLPKQSLLDNPMLQGLLSAYFSAAGAPRATGIGGALKAAGLGGLQAYDTARAAQYAPYKTLAELEKSGADVGKSRAEASLAYGKAQQLAGITQQNKDTATATRNYAKTITDPAYQKALLYQADIIEADRTKGVSLDEATKGALNAVNQFKVQQQTQLIQKQQDLTGAKTDVAKAQIGLIQSEEGRNAGAEALSYASADFIKSGKPMSLTEMTNLAQKSGDAAVAKLQKPMLTSADEWNRTTTKVRNDTIKGTLAALQAQNAQLVSGRQTPANKQRAGLAAGASAGAAGPATSSVGTGGDALPSGFSETPIDEESGSTD